MKLFFYALLLSITLCSGFDAHAAGSLLRVACDGDDVGAEVFLNGKFKGECPVDIQVSEGTFTVRVAKKVDAQREQSFEQDVRIGDGTVKKVAVVLSVPHLNAAAQKLEDDRLRVERALLAEERRRDEALLAQQQKDAAAGDSAAMVALGDRYASGKGVNQNEEEAKNWYSRAWLLSGNELATFKLSGLYKTGKREDVEAILRLLQLPTGPERNVSVEGTENLRAFIASDPFFEVPGGNQVIPLSYISNGYNIIGTCGREETRFFQLKTEVDKIPLPSTLRILGGLVTFEKKENGLFFGSNITEKLVRIEKLSGQPFPLTLGQRFVIRYIREENGFIGNPIHLTCAIDSEVEKTTRHEQFAGTGQPLLCLDLVISKFFRYSWHESSGCFVQERDR